MACRNTKLHAYMAGAPRVLSQLGWIYAPKPHKIYDCPVAGSAQQVIFCENFELDYYKCGLELILATGKSGGLTVLYSDKNSSSHG